MSPKIGEVGYIFTKYFPNHGFFEGKVVKIRPNAGALFLDSFWTLAVLVYIYSCDLFMCRNTDKTVLKKFITFLLYLKLKEKIGDAFILMGMWKI